MSKEWPFKRGGKGWLARDKVIWGHSNPSTSLQIYRPISYGRHSFFPGMLVDVSCLESFCHPKMQTWRWFTKKFSWLFFFFEETKFSSGWTYVYCFDEFSWELMGLLPRNHRERQKVRLCSRSLRFPAYREPCSSQGTTPLHLEGPPLEASQKHAFRPLLRCPFKEPWLPYKGLDKIHWVHRCPCFGERTEK